MVGMKDLSDSDGDCLALATILDLVEELVPRLPAEDHSTWTNLLVRLRRLKIELSCGRGSSSGIAADRRVRPKCEVD